MRIRRKKPEISKLEIKYRNKLSMIELKLRKYEEGRLNPFTLIRDIKEIIRYDKKFDITEIK